MMSLSLEIKEQRSRFSCLQSTSVFTTVNTCASLRQDKPNDTGEEKMSIPLSYHMYLSTLKKERHVKVELLQVQKQKYIIANTYKSGQR